MSSTIPQPNPRTDGKDFAALSEHAYCLLPQHYFNSPGKIDFTIEKKEMPAQIDTVLLAEADPAIRSALGEGLRAYGFRVLECSNGRDVLHKLGTELLDQNSLDSNVLFSDLSRANNEDSSISLQIASNKILKTVVAFTSMAQRKLRAQLENVGASCCSAPVSLALILSYLENLL